MALTKIALLPTIWAVAVEFIYIFFFFYPSFQWGRFSLLINFIGICLL